MIPSSFLPSLTQSQAEERAKDTGHRDSHYPTLWSGIWDWATSSPGAEVLMKTCLTLTLESQPLTSAKMK